MVDDSRTDIDTALAANIPVVAVKFGYSSVPVAELGPAAVIAHFDQLYGVVAHLRNQTVAVPERDSAIGEKRRKSFG